MSRRRIQPSAAMQTHDEDPGTTLEHSFRQMVHRNAALEAEKATAQGARGTQQKTAPSPAPDDLNEKGEIEILSAPPLGSEDLRQLRLEHENMLMQRRGSRRLQVGRLAVLKSTLSQTRWRFNP